MGLLNKPSILPQDFLARKAIRKIILFSVNSPLFQRLTIVMEELTQHRSKTLKALLESKWIHKISKFIHFSQSTTHAEIN